MNGEPAWTHQQFGDAKMTALHWAAYHNDSQVVKLLLERGARQMVNDENVAPIDVAAICHNSFSKIVLEDAKITKAKSGFL